MPYWDIIGFRDRICRHKVRWGENPFLLCRTVTPESVREVRLFCNCPECYDSRRRADRELLSHPFGSFSDPPFDKNMFMQELREADMKSCFSSKDARLILAMIQTDPGIPFSHSSSPLDWSTSALKMHVNFIITEYYPICGLSLLGTLYERLRVFGQSKGRNLLKRALRSHSLSPFGRSSGFNANLYPIRESSAKTVVDQGNRKYRYNPAYDSKFRICFRNIPGTIEYLMLHRCFYRGQQSCTSPVFSHHVESCLL